MTRLHPVILELVRRHFGQLEGLPAESRSLVHDLDAAFRQLESDRGRLGQALAGPAEQLAVRTNEFFLRRLQDVARIGYYYFNVRAGTWICSAAMEALFGITDCHAKTVEGWLEVVHPDERDDMRTYLCDHVMGGLNRFDREYRIVRRSDGQERWVHGLGELELDEQGRPVKMIGTIQDITERRLAETGLREVKEQLAATLNALPDLLFVLDREGRIRDFRSPDSAQLYVGPEHFLGRRVAEVLPPAAVAVISRSLTEAFESGSSRGATYSLVIGGKENWFEMTASRQGQSDSPNAMIIVLARDITERRKAEERLDQALNELELKVRKRTEELSRTNDSLRESEARTRMILENVPAGILLVDSETNVVLEANPSALAMSGYRPVDLVGKRCERLLEPLQGDTDPGVAPEVGGGEVERVLCRADGTRLPVLRTAVPITMAGRAVRLESFVDIHERKLAQQELTLAKEGAEAASRAKSEFLAMMSHEIRTPLSGVIGVLRLLARDRLGPKQQRYVQMACASAETLLKVINDILDFSKVEAGKLVLERVTFDLPHTVESIVGIFQPGSVARGLSLEFSIAAGVPRWVRGDSLRVGQVLMNLVGNALKFTEAGEVNVHVESRSQAGSGVLVRCTVRDTGIGVAPELQERLFEPFYQADSSARRRYGGTGLGLGICRQLVTLMGGTMGFESRLGEGSIFWFEVPFESGSADTHPLPGDAKVLLRNNPIDDAGSAITLPEPEPAPARAAMPSPGQIGEPARVLLAEDNELNQELAREMIEAAGCWCVCVANGRDAVEALRTGHYDLVFMDCMMPEMDGFAATRAIRAFEARRAASGPVRRIPIIALTANAMKGDRERCLAAGMDDFMGKPLEPEDIARMVDRWLSYLREVRPPTRPT